MYFNFQTEQKVLDTKKLEKIYLQNKDIFDCDANNVFVNNDYYTTPNNMFKALSENMNEKALYVW